MTWVARRRISGQVEYRWHVLLLAESSGAKEEKSGEHMYGANEEDGEREPPNRTKTPKREGRDGNSV
jgi:hypothetical protein